MTRDMPERDMPKRDMPKARALSTLIEIRIDKALPQ
jgi:hypothetical protein